MCDGLCLARARTEADPMPAVPEGWLADVSGECGGCISESRGRRADRL